MQDYFKISGVRVMTPTTYSALLSTTSTDDSNRDMRLDMHNTPIGTIAGYDITWRHITAKECAKILGLVLNKKEFSVHYFDILTAGWGDAQFYASNFNAPLQKWEDGVEYWDELAFNIRSIKAR